MKTKTPVAQEPAPFTAADAHRMLARDLERKRANALAKAKLEAQRAIERLQQTLAMIEAGSIPYHSERFVDDRSMFEALTEAAAADHALENLTGWTKLINA